MPDNDLTAKAKEELTERANRAWDWHINHIGNPTVELLVDFAAQELLASTAARLAEAVLEAKIQLLRDIHADAINEFGRQRGIKKSVNDYVGDLVRLRETELTKAHYAARVKGE